MSAVLSTHWSHSVTVGGVMLLQYTGTHRLAALMRCKMRDFLYVERGKEI